MRGSSACPKALPCYELARDPAARLSGCPWVPGHLSKLLGQSEGFLQQLAGVENCLEPPEDL